jgi:hypothetical protein
MAKLNENKLNKIYDNKMNVVSIIQIIFQLEIDCEAI